MRLQVEIATASWIASCATSSRSTRGGAALGQRQPLAQRQRRGLVGDAEREQARSFTRSRFSASSFDLGELALDARDLRAR